MVFKNQARGTDDKNKQKEFINVSISGLRMFFAPGVGKLTKPRICCGPISTSGL